uniref:Uncharacterized protein n=1 Tax=Candidatus Kentrum sp. LPFa TaxID=2126335 RepID=A0A450XG26_9GAMM|nr:MAG: hypothetical protein BECKLPF1236A_GA0070988_100067 [Candidatus Kentron sp. LPFa]VFK28247.1 MAG: hypothetical protein BECKLPF1236C_GA0070990_100627 [Candidatus Kentron sp. LPFa]
MATPDDIDAELTLEISGQNVTPEKFEDNKNSDTVIRFWNGKQPTGLTCKSAVHAANILNKRSFQDHGSIEGRLDMVTLRGNQHFNVYEPIWDEPIRCNVNDDLIEEAAKYFGRRVAVYGMVRYQEDGSPISITVEEIAPFPDAAEIPDFRDLKGILKGYA